MKKQIEKRVGEGRNYVYADENGSEISCHCILLRCLAAINGKYF